MSGLSDGAIAYILANLYGYYPAKPNPPLLPVCKYLHSSSYLRCAVEPTRKDCEGCSHYEAKKNE